MLGNRLKQARNSKGLTQKQLAILIDVKHNSISDWENDLHQPNTDQIKKICEVLGVNPNWLYGEDEASIIRETPANYFYTEDGEALPEEARKELDSFIEYLKMKYKK
jgi:transcriptional regulator with XRE-family HTH domain